MIWLNNNLLTETTFPNGERKLDEEQIKQNINFCSINKLSFKYLSDADLIDLMFIKKYLDTFNVRTALEIYYYPYSRMDRSKDGSAFTLQYVADFINSLDFWKVDIIEPHSNMCVGLTRKSHEVLLGKKIECE
jgi:ribose-phosphate pyrophosphokinase